MRSATRRAIIRTSRCSRIYSGALGCVQGLIHLECDLSAIAIITMPLSASSSGNKTNMVCVFI